MKKEKEIVALARRLAVKRPNCAVAATGQIWAYLFQFCCAANFGRIQEDDSLTLPSAFLF